MYLYDNSGPCGYLWGLPGYENNLKPLIHDLLKRYIVYGKKPHFELDQIRIARVGVVDVVWSVATCCKDVTAAMANAGAIVTHEVYKGVVTSMTIVISSSTGRSTHSPNQCQIPVQNPRHHARVVEPLRTGERS